MTNLFYPALSVYLQTKYPPLHPPSPPSYNTHRIPLSSSSSKISSTGRYKTDHPLSLLSTPVLDSFFPYPPPLLPRLIWAGWWGRDTGQQAEDDGWNAVRFEGDYTGNDEIKLMRVAWADVGDVLDGDPSEAERAWIQRDHLLLNLVRDTAEGWERQHSALHEGCIRQLQPESGSAEPTGPCYLLSPQSYPAESGVIPYDELGLSTNTTQDDDAVPVGWTANAGNFYHSIGVLFRIPKASAETFPARWAKSMSEMGKTLGGEVFVEAQGPRDGIGDQTGNWLLSVRYHLH
jgi:hypothetical protein